MTVALFLAGVASDDDELEEMLKKDKKLEHGFSSTVDLQRYICICTQSSMVCTKNQSKNHENVRHPSTMLERVMGL